jgi:hypothetical protein
MDLDSMLTLPPVIFSHVLAFCNGGDFDTLGQLSRYSHEAWRFACFEIYLVLIALFRQLIQ